MRVNCSALALPESVVNVKRKEIDDGVNDDDDDGDDDYDDDDDNSDDDDVTRERQTRETELEPAKLRNETLLSAGT